VLVQVYRGISKAFDQPRDTVHLGRRGRPVQKPRLMPLLTALSVARKLQATRIARFRCSFPHGLFPLHRHRAPAGGGRSPLGAALAA
jgi:hypothetical protein